MERYDVIIIGGGPAGSSCAWHLNRNGLKTAIIDKKSFPRNKICAGWITPAVLQSLEIDAADYGRNNVIQPITSFVTGIIGGKSKKSEYPDTVSYGIRRCEFDDYLLQQSGATTLLGEKLQSIVKNANEWRINDKYSAPMLIGAGGHFCPVARYLGANPGRTEAIVAAQEIEFAMSKEQIKQCSVAPETPELYFCEDLKGYGWIFRKHNFLNIGLGRQDNHKLNTHIDEFVRWLQRENKIPKPLGKKFQGHAYLLYGENDRPLLDDNVIVIGDAAGLAYAQSGEGIRPAIESALIAAQTVLNAAGNYEKKRLLPYVEQLEKRLGKRNAKSTPSKQNPIVESMLPKLGRIALNNHWFAKNIVINRWFLHSHQAVLDFQ